jgi:hypothetical protein
MTSITMGRGFWFGLLRMNTEEVIWRLSRFIGAIKIYGFIIPK